MVEFSRAHDLDLKLGSGHAAYHHASLIDLYLHNQILLRSEEKSFFSRITTVVTANFKVT